MPHRQPATRHQTAVKLVRKPPVGRRVKIDDDVPANDQVQAAQLMLDGRKFVLNQIVMPKGHCLTIQVIDPPAGPHPVKVRWSNAGSMPLSAHVS